VRVESIFFESINEIIRFEGWLSVRQASNGKKEDD
jgi:hypothetical protein